LNPNHEPFIFITRSYRSLTFATMGSLVLVFLCLFLMVLFYFWVTYCLTEY
jgi:hypothetical protein